MAEKVDIFSSLELAHTSDGGFFELNRDEEGVACPAFDKKRHCLVELHILNADGPGAPDPDVFDRLARAAAGLGQNRNLTKVYEYGEDDGACYFVCEFVDGEELGPYLKRCGVLPAELVIRLMRDAARGLVACSDAISVLAGLDLFRSRVVLSGNSVAEFGLKIGGFGFGDARAEELPAASVHRYYLGALARMAVWAAAGQYVRHTELEAAVSATLAPPLLELLEALDGAKPAVDCLEDGCGLVEQAFDAFGGAGFERFPAPLVPALPLQPIIVERHAISSYLGSESLLEGDPFDGRTPYRFKATSVSPDQSGVVQVLPDIEFLPSSISDDLLAALGQGNALDHPNLIRLLAYWPSENCAFYIEEDVGHIDLGLLIEWKKRFSPDEVLGLLEQLEAASQQAKTCGLSIEPVGAGQVAIHFIDSGFRLDDQTVRLLATMPLGEWPDFRLKVRTYPTFRSLARPAIDWFGERCTGARAFAWWARRLLDGHEPPKLHSLFSDVLSGRAGAMIQSTTEFLKTFRALVGVPEPMPEVIPLETGSRLAPGPVARDPEERIDLNPFRDDEPSDPEEAEEPDEPAPGLAEALFHSGGEDGPQDPDGYDDEPAETLAPQPTRFGNFLLTLLVVLIALLLAAIFAQLSGEAFWLK